MLRRRLVRQATQSSTSCFLYGASSVPAFPLPQGAIADVLSISCDVLGTGGLYQRMLRHLNSGYDDWDTTFTALGRDAETEVLAYCKRYGVQVELWIGEGLAQPLSDVSCGRPTMTRHACSLRAGRTVCEIHPR